MPGQVVRQRHDLEGRAQHKLAGVQDQRLAALDLDQAGEVGLVLGRVDEGVSVVVEQAEVLVQTHVDARWLDHRLVVRLEAHPPTIDLRLDVTV
jgi:hypothetical protein